MARAAGHPASPGPRRPGRRAEVRTRRRPQRARARQCPRDGRAGGRRSCREGAHRHDRHHGPLARAPDRDRAGDAAGVAAEARFRPGRGFARALPRSRCRGGHDRRDRAGQARARHARRSHGGAGVRSASRPGLACLGRLAARRPHRRGDGIDPVGQGRRDRRRHRQFGQARVARTRRDLPLRREGLPPPHRHGRGPRGRDDERCRSGGADDLEAAAHADAPARERRAQNPRAAAGPCRAQRRHRPPGRSVVAEAAVAWELARAAAEKFGGDAVGDFVAAHAAYLERVARA